MLPASNDPRFDFEANPTLSELIARQGKEPVHDLSVFRGAWPEDEPVGDFVAAVREWRGHPGSDRNNRAA